LAISILLYVLLDGVDLGVGLLFGLSNGEARRGAMLSAVAPIWDGNETWLVVTAVILWGAFPLVYAILLSIPSVITVDQAAAPQSSLVFMFWGCGVIVLPLMLVYTLVSYSVFRGKVRTTGGYEHR
jgi:cytochrome bd-type quinol oxidase subunit 2